MDIKYKVMGINDDVNYCGCCGKTGLKRVVWIAPLDADGNVAGEASPYGTTCAAYTLRITKEKGVRATAKIEAKINAELLKSIDSKIANIRKDFVQLNTTQGSYLLPPSLMNMGLDAALKARKDMFPILGFYDGTLNVKQAARHL